MAWRREWLPTDRILACRIPRTEEPGGLQSMGSQRVRHDRMTNTHTHTHTWNGHNKDLLYSPWTFTQYSIMTYDGKEQTYKHMCNWIALWCPWNTVSHLCAVPSSVAQSCLTLCDLTHCSPPGSSVHGDSPGESTGVGWPCPPAWDLHHPGIKSRSPALQVDSLPSESPGNYTLI